MRQSKFIQILKTLSKDEFLQFRKMLQSPFFVGNEVSLKLYDSIRRYYPTFDSAKLDKVQVFKKLYPDRPYDDNRMRDMMRKTNQLLKDFLIWKTLKTTERDYNKQLIKVYAERQLFSLYEKERKAFLQNIEALPYRGLQYYQDLFELHHDYYYHPQRQKNNQHDLSLQHLIQATDQRFMLAKLRIGIEARNQERIFQKKYTSHFLADVLEEATRQKDNLVLQLFSHLFQLYSLEDYAQLERLELLFFPNLHQLDLQDAQLIYFYGLNYINRKVNQGKSASSPRALAWYKFGLQDGLLIQQGKISEVSFGNIVTHGCRQQEFDWTKNFIAAHEEKIHATHLEDLLQFNWGLWHFYKGELEEAFSLLSKYNFHQSFQLKVRLTSLRVLFEQFLHNPSYYDALISYAKAFQKFILRENLYSPAVSGLLKRTIEMIKALTVKIRNQEKPESIQQWFAKKIASDQDMAVKAWLMEKVAGLK